MAFTRPGDKTTYIFTPSLAELLLESQSTLAISQLSKNLTQDCKGEEDGCYYCENHVILATNLRNKILLER